MERSWYEIEQLSQIRRFEAQQRAERYRARHRKADRAEGDSAVKKSPRRRWWRAPLARLGQGPTL
jgi:hypothetical protein